MAFFDQSPRRSWLLCCAPCLRETRSRAFAQMNSSQHSSPPWVRRYTWSRSPKGALTPRTQIMRLMTSTSGGAASPEQALGGMRAQWRAQRCPNILVFTLSRPRGVNDGLRLGRPRACDGNDCGFVNCAVPLRAVVARRLHRGFGVPESLHAILFCWQPRTASHKECPSVGRGVTNVVVHVPARRAIVEIVDLRGWERSRLEGGQG